MGGSHPHASSREWVVASCMPRDGARPGACFFVRPCFGHREERSFARKAVGDLRPLLNSRDRLKGSSGKDGVHLS